MINFIKNKIKKLEKGCGIETEGYDWINNDYYETYICGNILNDHLVLCPTCQAQLKLLKEIEQENEKEAKDDAEDVLESYKIGYQKGQQAEKKKFNDFVDKLKEDILYCEIKQYPHILEKIDKLQNEVNK